MKNLFTSSDLSFAQILQQAHKKQVEKKYYEAAHLYLQCSAEAKLDPRKKAEHTLHAAQCFERGHDMAKSSTYYLKSAEYYSETNHLQHGLSALKAYYRINQNHKPIQATLKKLRDQGFWHDDMIELLSDEEKAYHDI